MTKLLDQALEKVRGLPADDQDEIARAMLHLAEPEREPEKIDPAHVGALLEGIAQSRVGKYATDDQIEAAFRRFNR